MALRDTARRAAAPIVVGCLLGAATVGGTIFVSAAPASASCTSQHENVNAYDKSGTYFGNRGNIYINTSAVINSLHDALYRSLFIFVDTKNVVEVGWGAGPNNITGHSNPTVYAFWVNGGTPGHFTYTSVSEDTNRTFTVENVGHIEIFRFYFDGESSPFAYSPKMTFDFASPLTNSEHYNTCDSLWTHMYGLNYFQNDGTWSSSYGDLECAGNSAEGWYLHKDSNSELHVTQDSSGKLC